MTKKFVFLTVLVMIILILMAGYGVTAKQAEPVVPATNVLTAKLVEQVKNNSTEVGPVVLYATATHPMDGRTVTFTNGAVSGGVAWKSTVIDMAGATDYAYESTGGAPGSGRVIVETSSGSYEFALPITAPFTVDGVQLITIYAEAPIPYIPPWSTLGAIIYTNSYSANVIASVFWI